MGERVLRPLGDVLGMLVCYLVLVLLGWVNDTYVVREVGEPAP